MKYPVTERVKKLRELARSSSENHPLPLERMDYTRDDRYGWDDRQIMLFYEGWEAAWEQPTTVLRRVAADCYMLRNLPVIIDEDDLICGKPNYHPLSEEEQARYDLLRRKHLDLVPQVLGRTDHMALDFTSLLELGIEGLLEKTRHLRAALSREGDMAEYVEKKEYYDCVEMQLCALLELEDKYVCEAEKLGYTQLASLMNKVPRKPAETFHEALQSIHFYTFVLRGLFSCGRPDQLLIDYYRRDIQAGILTEEKALELLDCFNLQYTFFTRKLASISYMIGGTDPDGNPVENELTWLLLQSSEHIRIPYPSVGLAVTKETSREILDYSFDMLADGITHPAFFNHDSIVKGLLQADMKIEHAREFVHSTCVEITPVGRSGLWGTSPYINCAQLLLNILKDRQDFTSYEELEETLHKYLISEVHREIDLQNVMQMERRRNGGESILASCLVHDCLKEGKSIDQGGAQYNYIMPNFIGMSNMIDSLSAIRQCVFIDQRISLADYVQAVENNYEDNELLRQYILNRCEHFGNNESFTDDLARRSYAWLVEACQGLKTFRNSLVRPGAFSFIVHETFGKITAATPDGRKAGEALNAGSDPVSGRDISGPTASILSTTEWDQVPFIGGIAVNMRLNMTDLKDSKRDAMHALLQVFLERNGVEMQINCVNAEVLEDAMKNPEKHANLMVRIGGFSDFFVRQTPQMQREIIARTYHEL